MLLYFYLLPAAFFHELLRPALTQSWAQRRFAPCVPLCEHLLTPELPQDCLVRLVRAGLPFSRAAWQAFFGECLVFGSVDVPRLETSATALCCLLAGGRSEVVPRHVFAPIHQVHFGSRDLHCGGYYRPEHAGYNDRADVVRLVAYLEAQHPEAWRPEDLANLPLTAEERVEELADLHAWWPALVELYRRAAREDLVVACEEA